MATTAVVSFDKFGRITIPKFLRDLLGAQRFVASVEKKNLKLEPIDWESQLGTVPQINMKKFWKQHETDWND